MITTVGITGISKGNDLIGLRLIVFTKSVPLQRRLQVASLLTYTQNDLQVIFNTVRSDEIKFLDYYDNEMPFLLNKWGISNISIQSKDWMQNIQRLKMNKDKLPVFFDYLKLYNPYYTLNMVQVENVPNVKMFVDTAPKSIKYIHINGVPVCYWSPSASNIRSYKDLKFQMVDGILLFRKFEEIYILSDASLRHRPVNIGDELTINLGNGFCMKTVSYIQDNTYINKCLRFDSMQRQWIVVRADTPIPIFGCKKK